MQDLNRLKSECGALPNFKSWKHFRVYEKKNTKYYLNIINQIEEVRSKNNINWMDVLRLTFKLSPNEAKKLVKKINIQDSKISNLLKKLSKN